jgi:acetamidase/formamidase
MSTADAYALASLSVDFRVGEAVNDVKMVYGMIPKRIFTQQPEYWRQKQQHHHRGKKT